MKVDRSRILQLGDAGLCDGGLCADAAACFSPACCQGCWDGIACLPGDSAPACGDEGATCVSCAAPLDSCREGRCVASKTLLSITASDGHSCVADDQQRLWCWGDNLVGQVAADPPLVPQPLVIATGGWVNVSAGGAVQEHTCAIHFRGSLWCWGDNSRGQLGLGPMETRTSLSRVTQVNSDSKESWLQVSAGNLMTCAIRDDGTLWCWGAGNDGRLAGEGDTPLPRMVGSDRDWRSVSSGFSHACAVKQDNSLWCWGSNVYGKLGRADTTVGGFSARPGVVDTSFLNVSAGHDHSCGVRLDNSVWCWGRGLNGRLGVPGAQDESRPQRVGAPYTTVSAGGAHTCAVHRNGSLACWGHNEQGQLGTGNATPSADLPTPVAQGQQWLRVVAGGAHSCALADDGTLWCWGSGARGQTGLGAQSVAVPTLVPLR